ncbi:hypothetical protein FOZ61_009152 [Perkinsus olseni]|uniref:EF-hand domain-containing protein n=1 Tax=Perkinsus olseni TaxID=32597 RepID=A0A7J6L174_PEROL|nr:hypothetical protein FOZ61_009152 [Perkinsus olseni]KAF4655411.1 hypothetical protein FOL46_008267 [Perkinsus olseni]
MAGADKPPLKSHRREKPSGVHKWHMAHPPPGSSQFIIDHFKDMRTVFELADTDGDGYLTKPQAADWFRTVGFCMTTAAIDSLILSRIVTNHSLSKFNFREMLQAADKSQKFHGFNMGSVEDALTSSLMASNIILYGSVVIDGKGEDLEIAAVVKELESSTIDAEQWRRGAVCLLVASLSFSLMSLLAAHLALVVPITLILLARSVVQTAMAAVGCRILRKSMWDFENNELRFLVMSRGLGGALSTLMRFLSVSLIPLGESLSIHGTHSVFSLLLSWVLLKQPIRAQQVITVIAVTCGVLLLAQSSEVSSTSVHQTSRLCGIGAALCGSLMASWVYITVTKAGEKVHWSQLTLWYGICGIAVSLIVLLVGCRGSTLPYLREANSWSMFMLVLVGCISFTGQTFFNIGLQLTSSAVTSSIVRQMDVVFGFIFQIFIQHHPSTATNVADVSDGATLASSDRQPTPAEQTPEKAMSPTDQAKDMSLGKWSKKNKWFIPTLVCLCLASFAGQYTGNSWSTVFGVLGADRYNLSEQENGEAMGIQAVVVIICTIIYIYVSDKIKPGLVSAFGFCLVVLAVIVPFIYSIWGTIVIGMCVYVGVTFFFAGMAYCSALISPPRSRGLINSISMGMTNVGGVLGPLVGGQLYDLNVADPYYVMCGLGVLGIASSLVMTAGSTYTEKLLREGH